MQGECGSADKPLDLCGIHTRPDATDVEIRCGDIFDAVVGKKPNYPAKPDPKLTLEVISDLKVKSEECAFVGDSGMDMQTAVNSGSVAVGVLWGFRERKELEECGAIHIIEKPCQLLEVLEI